uniref:proline-rich membrane anchor 1-like isoform X4 n=1 Tax=Oncorhynchus gorbuscha TaxID=8017 RepID=UPI001EAF244F|nr:proline-rich membrane anchor 1-like isoform X4 [Oncorhynchus gorbuscha]
MGELQRSCSQTVTEKVSEHCQLACQCRSYPPLPPPPPPPPPPRLLLATVVESPLPLLRPWWMEILVLGTVGCASAVFLLSAMIICYKAIKRKPLRKEENGTSRGEYAMSHVAWMKDNVQIKESSENQRERKTKHGSGFRE